MVRRVKDMASCSRCGLIRKVRSGRSDICKDCRLADPVYVQAIEEGRRCA